MSSGNPGSMENWEKKIVEEWARGIQLVPINLSVPYQRRSGEKLVQDYKCIILILFHERLIFPLDPCRLKLGK